MTKDLVQPDQNKDDDTNAGQGHLIPNPLDGVFGGSERGSIFGMHTGLFNLGRNRARDSGTTEPLPNDIRSLEDNARAMARDTYRDRYDPSANVHDAMHQAEYERTIDQRKESEKGEQHAAANLRDTETNLARAPKPGTKPAAPPVLVAAFIVAITLTVAPTLHDAVFLTVGDDLLEWFFSSLCAAFVGTMLTLAILKGRRTVFTWVGVGAGVVLGIGLGAVRLARAEGAGDVVMGIGLTIVEVAAVLLLEWLASGLRERETVWEVKHVAESQAIAHVDAAKADLTRWKIRVKELGDAIANKIAFVEDRHNRNIHIAELEAVAVKAVLDGYNAGIAENVGRIRGASGRTI
jgi:hypothetical protein